MDWEHVQMSFNYNFKGMILLLKSDELVKQAYINWF